MPAFPERESSLLSKLHETAPWTLKLEQEGTASSGEAQPQQQLTAPAHNGLAEPAINIGSPVDALISGESRLH